MTWSNKIQNKMIENSPKQQAVELIREAKSVLVATHKSPDGDALGSIVALKIALEKLGKNVAVVTPEKPNGLFSFLPRFNEIGSEIEASNETLISLSTSKTKLAKIGYKKGENHVDIVVEALAGRFESGDITVEPPKAKYDLIICIDTPNLERLGKLAQPADMFYEIPVINIDHHPSNERFGKVNWVELVATSTAEILVSLFEALGRETQLIDADAATALLTGLIYDTSSFQNVNTTPKSLTVAAQLVAHGARQQEIIRNLYKTKSLETLKLWGIILSNVKEDKSSRFLWSSVSKSDVAKVGADESALSGVVDELLKSATDVDFVLLLSEREGQVHGSLRSIAKGINVSEIAEIFSGGGHEVAAAFRINGNLSENESKILEKIRQYQGRGTIPESRIKEKDTEKLTLEPKPEEKIPPKIEEKATISPSIVSGWEEKKEQPEKIEDLLLEDPIALPHSDAKVKSPAPEVEEKNDSLPKKEDRVETKW